MGLKSIERPRNGIFNVLPVRIMGREPKERKKGEGKETVADKPLDFQNPVRGS